MLKEGFRLIIEMRKLVNKFSGGYEEWEQSQKSLGLEKLIL
jgi:hypothetical protein